MFGTSNRAEARLTFNSVCAFIKLDATRIIENTNFLNIGAIY
jgi:hypothetical protein